MPSIRFLGPHGESTIAFHDAIVLGRDAKCTVAFPDDKDCSRQHARIAPNGDAWVVEDLGSRNGAYLERGRSTRRVTAATILENGDVIHLTPRTKLTFLAETVSPAPLLKPAVTGDTWFGKVKPTFLAPEPAESHTLVHESVVEASMTASPEHPASNDSPASDGADLASRVQALESRVAELEALVRRLTAW